MGAGFPRTSACPCYTYPVASRALAEIAICSSSGALTSSEWNGMMPWVSLSCWHWEANTTNHRKSDKEDEPSKGQSLFLTRWSILLKSFKILNSVKYRLILCLIVISYCLMPKKMQIFGSMKILFPCLTGDKSENLCYVYLSHWLLGFNFGAC